MNDLVTKETGDIAVATDPVTYAMQNGATIEQLEKFMALKERHEANEAKKAFVKAMADFRAKAPAIKKTRKGHNCTFAGLAETIDSITATMADCGLSHRWQTKQESGQVVVTCYVTHIMGHSESAVLQSSPDSSGSKNSIQAIGSANSYLQRYTLFSVLGLAASDQDDDGSSSEVELITKDQANKIHSLISENDLNMDKFLRFIKQKLKCNSIEEINLNGYGLAISSIQTTIKNKKVAK